MNTIIRMMLWLAFILASFLPAFALMPTAPENRVWEIFSFGYDVPVDEAIAGYDSLVRLTSAYDEASHSHANGETSPTLGTCVLLGPNAKFNAVEGTVTEGTQLYRVFGGETKGLRQYYMTVNPAEVSNFLNAAGLFPVDSAQFVLEGTLRDTKASSSVT